MKKLFLNKKIKKECKKIENIINENLEIKNKKNNEIGKEQSNFLNSILGKAINGALDIGIRALLPDFIEDQVINIKDNLLNYGLKDGIKETINDTIDLGKSAIGILTGNFENTNQMKEAVKQGGLIDGISSALDFAIDKANSKGKIDKNVASLLSNGKEIILNNVESNIEKTFEKQNKKEINLSKYISEWKNNYNNKDFEKMEKTYSKIEKELKDLAPIEKIVKEARAVENLHTLIKNNGQNFNINKNQLELIESL